MMKNILIIGFTILFAQLTFVEDLESKTKGDSRSFVASNLMLISGTMNNVIKSGVVKTSTNLGQDLYYLLVQQLEQLQFYQVLRLELFWGKLYMSQGLEIILERHGLEKKLEESPLILFHILKNI